MAVLFDTVNIASPEYVELFCEQRQNYIEARNKASDQPHHTDTFLVADILNPLFNVTESVTQYLDLLFELRHTLIVYDRVHSDQDQVGSNLETNTQQTLADPPTELKDKTLNQLYQKTNELIEKKYSVDLTSSKTIYPKHGYIPKLHSEQVKLARTDIPSNYPELFTLSSRFGHTRYENNPSFSASFISDSKKIENIKNNIKNKKFSKTPKNRLYIYNAEASHLPQNNSLTTTENKKSDLTRYVCCFYSYIEKKWVTETVETSYTIPKDKKEEKKLLTEISKKLLDGPNAPYLHHHPTATGNQPCFKDEIEALFKDMKKNLTHKKYKPLKNFNRYLLKKLTRVRKKIKRDYLFTLNAWQMGSLIEELDLHTERFELTDKPVSDEKNISRKEKRKIYFKKSGDSPNGNTYELYIYQSAFNKDGTATFKKGKSLSIQLDDNFDLTTAAPDDIKTAIRAKLRKDALYNTLLSEPDKKIKEMIMEILKTCEEGHAQFDEQHQEEKTHPLNSRWNVCKIHKKTNKMKEMVEKAVNSFKNTKTHKILKAAKVATISAKLFLDPFHKYAPQHNTTPQKARNFFTLTTALLAVAISIVVILAIFSPPIGAALGAALFWLKFSAIALSLCSTLQFTFNNLIIPIFNGRMPQRRDVVIAAISTCASALATGFSTVCSSTIAFLSIFKTHAASLFHSVAPMAQTVIGKLFYAFSHRSRVTEQPAPCNRLTSPLLDNNRRQAFKEMDKRLSVENNSTNKHSDNNVLNPAFSQPSAFSFASFKRTLRKEQQHFNPHLTADITNTSTIHFITQQESDHKTITAHFVPRTEAFIKSLFHGRKTLLKTQSELLKTRSEQTVPPMAGASPHNKRSIENDEDTSFVESVYTLLDELANQAPDIRLTDRLKKLKALQKKLEPLLLQENSGDIITGDIINIKPHHNLPTANETEAKRLSIESTSHNPLVGMPKSMSAPNIMALEERPKTPNLISQKRKSDLKLLKTAFNAITYEIETLSSLSNENNQSVMELQPRAAALNNTPVNPVECILPNTSQSPS